MVLFSLLGSFLRNYNFTLDFGSYKTRSLLGNSTFRFDAFNFISMPMVYSSVYMIDLNDANSTNITHDEKLEKMVPIFGKTAHEFLTKDPQNGLENFYANIVGKGNGTKVITNRFGICNLTSVFLECYVSYVLGDLNNEYLRPCLILPNSIRLKEREIILKCAKDAGLTDIDFVSDCDAAFCYMLKYHLTRTLKSSLIIFVDIGAYYFRCFAYSVVFTANTQFYSRHGYNLIEDFAGDLITRRFADHIIDTYDLHIKHEHFGMFLDKINDAKMFLSEMYSYELDLNPIIPNRKILLRRSHLEYILPEIVDVYCKYIGTFVRGSQLNVTIELYGGSASIPYIRAKINETFGNVRFHLGEDFVYTTGALHVRSLLPKTFSVNDEEIVISASNSKSIIAPNVTGIFQISYRRITYFDKFINFEYSNEALHHCNFTIELIDNERRIGDMLYIYIKFSPLQIQRIESCVYRSCEEVPFKYTISDDSSSFINIVKSNYGQYFKPMIQYYRLMMKCREVKNFEESRGLPDILNLCKNASLVNLSDVEELANKVQTLDEEFNYLVEVKDLRSKECKRIIYKANQALQQSFNLRFKRTLVNLTYTLTDICKQQHESEKEEELINTLDFMLDVLNLGFKTDTGKPFFVSHLILISFVVVSLLLFYSLPVSD